MSILSLVLFCFVASATPGPANIAIFSVSGSLPLANSVRFIIGICTGFLLVLLASALPLTAIFLLENEAAYFVTIIKWIGALYLLYLSYKLFNSRESSTLSNVGFFHGLVIHPLSPKAWFFVLSAYSTFVRPGQNLIGDSITYVLVFILTAIFAHVLWCILGVYLKNKLSVGSQYKLNKSMASLLAVIVIYSLVIDTLGR